jgi:peptidoglycan hydrolase-like protein with peptidoglycan-binding domain
VRDLSIGDTGADVVALQQFLLSSGYAIPQGATGYFGLETQSALRAFQATHSITPSAGYLGPKTRAYMNEASSESNQSVVSTAPLSPVSFVRDLQKGMYGEDVRLLQQYLNKHGFVVASQGPGAPVEETTYFGERTETVLAVFQKENNIVPWNGYFGPITRALIGDLKDSNQMDN